MVVHQVDQILSDHHKDHQVDLNNHHKDHHLVQVDPNNHLNLQLDQIQVAHSNQHNHLQLLFHQEHILKMVGVLEPALILGTSVQ